MTTSRILVVGRNNNIPRLGTYADRPIHLGSMTNEELLSYFRFTRNDITTTRLEEELASRLEALIDDGHENEDLEKQIEQMTETNSDLTDQVRALEDKLADIKNIING